MIDDTYLDKAERELIEESESPESFEPSDEDIQDRATELYESARDDAGDQAYEREKDERMGL